MSARYIVGDVFEGLATLPDNSVDLVFSSPPFLALRSYLPSEHPDKGKEIGSEATPADFLDTLLDVVEACDRVLAPHGSLCFELGDTFAGSIPGGAATYGEIDEHGQMNAWKPNPYGPGRTITRGRGTRKPKDGNGWPLDKSLCGIPTLFAWSLAYGRNLLRPERETPRWRIRNLVVWARPNPPVGALGDKYRPATSYLTVATKARDRYFDLDAVWTPHNEEYAQRRNVPPKGTVAGVPGQPMVNRVSDEVTTLGHPAGAPPLDYWVLPTANYAGAHYATFPPDLVVKPVKSMCPQRVCRVCGEPSRRITETECGPPSDHTDDDLRGNNKPSRYTDPAERFRRAETLGWTDCGHNDWRPGAVLDCFAGSGTTLAVATGHGRDAIGIDLDARNADLALERVGPLLMTVETLTSEPAA